MAHFGGVIATKALVSAERANSLVVLSAAAQFGSQKQCYLSNYYWQYSNIAGDAGSY